MHLPNLTMLIIVEYNIYPCNFHSHMFVMYVKSSFMKFSLKLPIQNEFKVKSSPSHLFHRHWDQIQVICAIIFIFNIYTTNITTQLGSSIQWWWEIQLNHLRTRFSCTCTHTNTHYKAATIHAANIKCRDMLEAQSNKNDLLPIYATASLVQNVIITSDPTLLLNVL